MKAFVTFIAGLLAAAPGFAAQTGGDAPEPLEALGRALFFDTDLSANRNQSCASCHDPAAGFGSPFAEFNAAGSVVEGSVPGRFGNRKPPSVAYATFSPILHHIIDDGDVTIVGGAFLDGRATGKKLGSPTADQAQGPLLNPVEMGLPHAACVVARVVNPEDPDKYAVSFADVWGEGGPGQIRGLLRRCLGRRCDGRGSGGDCRAMR